MQTVIAVCIHALDTLFCTDTDCFVRTAS